MAKGEDDTAVLEEIKEVLLKHRHAIYSVYAHYCINGAAHDRYVMGLLEYTEFVKDCELADPASKDCRKADFDRIFVASDVEDRGGRMSQEQKEFNSANIDRALMRFEWVQALVRIALAKYMKSENAAGVGDALEKLFTERVLKMVPPEALHDSDVFRRQRLYTREVHDVFTHHENNLRAIYEAFAAAIYDQKAGPSEARAKDKLMDLAEFELLLNAASLFDEDFTKRHASLCFLWAQSFCTDDLKRRTVLTHLSYVDFLEALARITTFKPLPTAALLESTGAKSCAHFFMQAKAGMHGPKQQLHKPVLWQEEEVASRSLAEPLRMLLELFIERLDLTGTGVLTLKELKKLI